MEAIVANLLRTNCTQQELHLRLQTGRHFSNMFVSRAETQAKNYERQTGQRRILKAAASPAASRVKIQLEWGTSQARSLRFPRQQNIITGSRGTVYEMAEPLYSSGGMLEVFCIEQTMGLPVEVNFPSLLCPIRSLREQNPV